MVCSPTDGSARPTALASPQSTTSVSPCLPTMMLAGLMSRWITPRRVGVIDGVADVEEAAEQLAQLQRPAAGVVLRASRRSWNCSMASLSESPLMNRMA